ncbi:uncharacterized protein LOC120296205 [Eucalyptus grandis]|uniref:uncharacterized protein LOC120296205 n=1 Tax=Eucalyptus grandis TaxID=71139 RepID=UPI00192EFBF9|nr:uncharacterized protein LOC120296205 [Eucalyptus grandis]
MVELSDLDLQATDPKLHDCLIGYYLGRRIPFKVTEEALKRAWSPYLTEVMANGKCFFMLHITDMDFRRKLLEGGPITVAKVPFILQQWKPDPELEKDTHLIVPVWVKLRNLPFSFWSARAIGKVASATSPLASCDSILLVHNGNSRIVAVEYEWCPQVCSKCGIFGHNCNTLAPRQTSNLRRRAAKAPVSVVLAPIQLPQDRLASPVLVVAHAPHQQQDSERVQQPFDALEAGGELAAPHAEAAAFSQVSSSVALPIPTRNDAGSSDLVTVREVAHLPSLLPLLLFLPQVRNDMKW